MNKKQKQLISDIYNDLMVDIEYTLKNGDISSFDELYAELEEHNGLDVDIIYHSRAIEYLQEHDPSLIESLSIAKDFGYELDALNSEILASLHASQRAREDLHLYDEDITSAFFSQ